MAYGCHTADYLASLQGNQVVVIGIGFPTPPLIETPLLQGGFLLPPVIRVPGRTLGFGGLAGSDGSYQQLKEHYLDGWTRMIRSPGIRRDIPRSWPPSSGSPSGDGGPFPSVPLQNHCGHWQRRKGHHHLLIAEMLKTCKLHRSCGEGTLGNLFSQRRTGWGRMAWPSWAVLLPADDPQASRTLRCLPISPNHLDVHTSMEEYAQAKEKHFLPPGPGDLAIFKPGQ